MAEDGASGPARKTPAPPPPRPPHPDHWERSAARLRGRNLVTGLAIGAFVVGMCILHTESLGPQLQATTFSPEHFTETA